MLDLLSGLERGGHRTVPRLHPASGTIDRLWRCRAVAPPEV